MPSDHQSYSYTPLPIHILLCSGEDTKLPTVCWSCENSGARQVKKGEEYVRQTGEVNFE